MKLVYRLLAVGAALLPSLTCGSELDALLEGIIRGVGEPSLGRVPASETDRHALEVSP